MKNKISILLIALLSVVLLFSSITTPTYCLYVPENYYKIEKLTRSEVLSYGNNYYNAQNLNYVYLENFNFTRSVGTVLYFVSDTYNSTLSNIPDYKLIEDVYFNYYGDKLLIGSLVQEFSFNYDTSNLQFTCNLNSFKFILNSNLDYSKCCLGISDLDLDSIFIECSSFPVEYLKTYLSNMSIISNVYTYRPIKISFDLNFTNQYYYNDIFGITLSCRTPFEYPTFYGSNYMKDFNQSFVITDVSGNSFYFNDNTFNSNIAEERVYLITNSYNYDASIYKSISYCNNYANFRIGDISYMNFVDEYYSKFRFTFSTPISEYVENDTSSTLYSINSNGLNSNTSSLIPLSSSSYYKSAEWYEIGSHLYNFFIYIIFDAPIISDFTKLIAILINLIVGLFEFLIGLFSGIESVFFVSIFIGFLVLIFILKIIFKG